ncbi:MAG: preprotein translocase subunit SecE [Lachnospiraceae bacterium]|nr:preprotein translocase subunit SecE [Lachnospiraceae bacterium]
MAETTDKAPKKSFFKGLKSEFRKIVWPGKEDLAKQTVIVVVVSLILGVLITAIDSVVLEGINLLVK